MNREHTAQAPSTELLEPVKLARISRALGWRIIWSLAGINAGQAGLAPTKVKTKRTAIVGDYKLPKNAPKNPKKCHLLLHTSMKPKISTLDSDEATGLQNWFNSSLRTGSRGNLY